MQYRKPGIYYNNLLAYPPETGLLRPAVPALIGYTEKAEDKDGNSLLNTPTRISSLEEYEALFGVDYPIRYEVSYGPYSNKVYSVSPAFRFYLYPSLRLFFDNGGRDIYIVSVGLYGETSIVDYPTLNALKAGVDSLENQDEPNVILFPDSVQLDHQSLGQLQDYTLNHAAELKDRFAIFDLREHLNPEASIAAFREHLGFENLDRGAAYYPWILGVYSPRVNPKEFIYTWVDEGRENPDKGGKDPDKDTEKVEAWLVESSQQTNSPVEVAVAVTEVPSEPLEYMDSPVVDPLREESMLGMGPDPSMTGMPYDETIGPDPSMGGMPFDESMGPDPSLGMPYDESMGGVPMDADMDGQPDFSEKMVPAPPAPPEAPLKDEYLNTDIKGAKKLDWALIVANLVQLPEKPLMPADFEPLQDHLQRLKDQLEDGKLSDLELVFAQFMAFQRSLVLAFANLDARTDLPEEMKALLNELREDQELRHAMQFFAALEQERNIMLMQNRSLKQVTSEYGQLVGPDKWMLRLPDAVQINYQIYPLPADQEREAPEKMGQLNFLTAYTVLNHWLNSSTMSSYARHLVDTYSMLFSLAQELDGKEPNKPEVPQSVIEQALSIIAGMRHLLPPSGAVAGLFARTDRQRGIWKAPANDTLHEVLALGHYLNVREQELMNIHHTGKSVNALIPEVGSGVVVHGARTLLGNDPQWRYVPVRRYFTAVERAVKQLLQPYMFEPNQQSTWSQVEGVLDGFFRTQWREGALKGDRPEQAWFINVGLGETMNEADLLQGRMRVDIGLSVVRPAEFIVLTFIQKMELT